MILGGGYLTYLSYGDLFKGQYWLEVIQGEALPYYTPAYIEFGTRGVAAGHDRGRPPVRLDFDILVLENP